MFYLPMYTTIFAFFYSFFSQFIHYYNIRQKRRQFLHCRRIVMLLFLLQCSYCGEGLPSLALTAFRTSLGLTLVQ